MCRFVVVLVVSAVLCGLSTGAPTSYGATTEAPSTTYTAVESVSSATTMPETSSDYQTKMETKDVRGSSMGPQSGGKRDCDKTKGSHAGKYGTPEGQDGAPSTYPSSAKDEYAPAPSEQPLTSYEPSATYEPSPTSEPSVTSEPVASYGPSASYGSTASEPSSPTTIAPRVYSTSYSSSYADGNGHNSMSNGSMAYSPGTGGPI
jgi:hypothetical protein